MFWYAGDGQLPRMNARLTADHGHLYPGSHSSGSFACGCIEMTQHDCSLPLIINKILLGAVKFSFQARIVHSGNADLRGGSSVGEGTEAEQGDN